MQAVAFTQVGEPGVLRLMDVTDPVVGPGQVRIRVKVSGVNFRDVGVRRYGRNEGSKVPEPEGSIVGSGGKEIAIRAEGHALDRTGVADEIVNQAARTKLPEFDGSVA